MRRMWQTVWCCKAHTPPLLRDGAASCCARNVERTLTDLSAAFAAATTIVDMRIPLPHGSAAANLTSVSKQTIAPPQMGSVVSSIKAARTKPLPPLVTVSYRSAAIYPIARACGECGKRYGVVKHTPQPLLRDGAASCGARNVERTITACRAVV